MCGTGHPEADHQLADGRYLQGEKSLDKRGTRETSGQCRAANEEDEGGEEKSDHPVMPSRALPDADR